MVETVSPTITSPQPPVPANDGEASPPPEVASTAATLAEAAKDAGASPAEAALTAMNVAAEHHAPGGPKD